MSLLEKAKPAGKIEREKYRLRVLLGGPSGSGKTQAIITLPREEGKPILLLDYDNRSETVAEEPGIVILKLHDPDPTSPKAWLAGEQVRRELWALAKKGEFPYSGVVEDSLSMMGNIAMNYALTYDVEHQGLGGAPGQSHWMPQIHALRNHLNSMRLLPCNYVLTCHMEMMQEGESGQMKLYPKVTRSLKTEIPTWFNETYYCQRTAPQKGGKRQYYWVTMGGGKLDFFKSTLNNQGKFWRDPVIVDLDKKPAGFEKLLALRFGGQKGGTNEQQSEGDILDTDWQGGGEETAEGAALRGALAESTAAGAGAGRKIGPDRPAEKPKR